MRSVQLFSLFACVSAFGAVTLEANVAHAISCCAPLCQAEEPPPICARCTPCAEETMSLEAQVNYDEEAGICEEVEASPESGVESCAAALSDLPA